MREVHVPPVWTDAGAFVGEVPDWFRLDRTRGQEHVVYVAAEKDTLRQLPTNWLADLGIPVLVVRGFGSQSYVDVVRERTATCIRTGRDWRVAAEELGLFIVWLKFGSKPVTGIERPVGNGLVYPGPGTGTGAEAVREPARIQNVLTGVRQFLLHGITAKTVPSSVMVQLYEVADPWDLPEQARGEELTGYRVGLPVPPR
ncbi:hypothetical protein ACFXKF_27245 [Streptomyces scopuliridis]|uniref:hypothetical protein n=1 Tax=Streptomyces scopuliridis TaxID=452529 RepID=UPI003687F253